MSDIAAPANTTSLFLIGNRGSGKTCFFSGLYECGRAHQSGSVSILTGRGDTGQYLEEMAEFRRHGRWPAPTTGTLPLQLTVQFRGKLGTSIYRVQAVDYPGEDLRRSLLELDTAAQATVQEGLSKAEVILVLIDPSQDVDVGISMRCSPEEMRARQDLLVKTVGDVLEGRIAQRRNRRRAEIHLVISKADLLPEPMRQMKALRAAILERNQNLIDRLGGWMGTAAIGVHACSAYGPAQADSSPPSNATPEGYGALLHAIDDERCWQRTQTLRRRIGISAVVAVCLLIAVIGWRWMDHRTATDIIVNMPLSAAAEYLRGHGEPATWSEPMAKTVNDRLAKMRSALKQQLDGGTVIDLEQMRHLRDNVRTIERFPGNQHATSDKAMLDECNERLMVVMWERIKSAGKTMPAVALIDEFLNEFPLNPRAAEARSIKEEVFRTDLDRRVGELISRRPKNSNDLRSAANDIDNMLQLHAEDLARRVDVVKLRQARDTALSLAGADRLRVTLQSCEFAPAKGAREHAVKWSDAAGNLKLEAWTGITGTSSTFTSDFECKINSPQRYTIQLWDYDYGDEEMAVRDFEILELVAWMDGSSPIRLNDSPSDEHWRGTDASIKAQVAIASAGGWTTIKSDALAALRAFIMGDAGWKGK